MVFDLPKELEVNGVNRSINSDFRDIISIMSALNDPELSPREKNFVLLTNFYAEDDISELGDLEEAVKKAIWFIDWGKEYSEKEKAPSKLLDWAKDYNYVVSAVNRRVKTVEDVRELPYLHWWTFLGYFAERGQCQISYIIEIRDKIARGKPLDAADKEFYKANKTDIDLDNERDTELEAVLWGDKNG